MRASLNINTTQQLRNAWQELVAEGAVRSREAADKLGVSEAALVRAGAGFKSAHEVDCGDVGEALRHFSKTHRFMWLVRNEGAVLEVDGAPELTFEGGVVRIAGKSFTVSLELSAIASATYIKPEKGLARSLQLFDGHGTAILKVYLKNANRADDLDATLAPYCRDVAEDAPVLTALPVPAFSPSASPESGEAAEATAYRDILEQARDAGLPIILRASNRGASIEVTSTPRKVEAFGPWFNILDPGMNLHLNEAIIVSARQFSGEDEARWQFLDADEAVVLEIAQKPASDSHS